MEKTNEIKGSSATEVAPGLSVEEIRAIFFNADALREPAYKVFQLNSDGHRYYYRFENGTPVFYPSVTTLLKQVMPTPPALLEWMMSNGKDGSVEKRDLAAAYGTFMHTQFETLLITRRYDFDAAPAVLMAYMERENLSEKVYTEWLVKIRKDILAFAQFVRDYNVKPLAVEIALVHPELHYAGCLDLPCVMTDPKTGNVFTAIVDFKSGRKGFYEEHELQLHLYRAMWNYNFPDNPMERLFNFAPKDWRGSKPTYNLKDQTDSVNAPKLQCLLGLAAIEDAKRDNTITVIGGVLDLDKGKIADNVQTISLAELISKRVANAEAPTTTSDAPIKAIKKPVKRTKDAEPVNTTSTSEKSVETKNDEKLPWENETPIVIEKIDSGVKVTGTYYESVEQKTVDVDADKKAIEALEQGVKNDLLFNDVEM